MPGDGRERVCVGGEQDARLTYERSARQVGRMAAAPAARRGHKADASRAREIAPPKFVVDWNTFVKSSPNPNAPSLEEAIRESLSAAEKFTACLRLGTGCLSLLINLGALAYFGFIRYWIALGSLGAFVTSLIAT